VSSLYPQNTAPTILIATISASASLSFPPNQTLNELPLLHLARFRIQGGVVPRDRVVRHGDARGHRAGIRADRALQECRGGGVEGVCG
jgi:hypothetical protein